MEKEIKIKQHIIPMMEIIIRLVDDFSESLESEGLNGIEKDFEVIRQIDQIVNSQDHEDKKILTYFLVLAFSLKPEMKNELLEAAGYFSFPSQANKGNMQRFLEAINTDMCIKR